MRHLLEHTTPARTTTLALFSGLHGFRDILSHVLVRPNIVTSSRKLMPWESTTSKTIRLASWRFDSLTIPTHCLSTDPLNFFWVSCKLTSVKTCRPAITSNRLRSLVKCQDCLNQLKDVRAQSVPTYRFSLNLPSRKVMIFFCQKGERNGGSPCSFSRSWGALLEACVILRRS